MRGMIQCKQYGIIIIIIIIIISQLKRHACRMELHSCKANTYMPIM